ncbi:helix-turn-helix domain-containing protein [Streptomyces silvisoli]|uniref:Helix-turn-helix transcriptional regulator n=1 Tax=Streptomyces silvisoli TaxID=3034235 RepID=A0ABT5ZRE3_9ACTN|nr:helix-turn-helix transcriptional regulator [Streptomyces silvisoli]MDF3292381.1 helix-turn-helix transcriptional regulator [Streptomyces silvisoli]
MSADRCARAAQPVPMPGADVCRDAATRALGNFLRDLRNSRGLSMAEAKGAIRGSVSKISRLERGESPPKEQDVWDLARLYRASESEMEDIHSLLRSVRQSSRRNQFSDVTPQFLRRLIELEKSAEHIRTYENHVVPGLLQTAEYARAVIEAAIPGADNITIGQHLHTRKDRWELLFSAQDTEVTAALDEGVLRRMVGGPKVMVSQLQHLLMAAGEDMPKVNIRIIPFDEGLSTAPSFPITHLTFKNGGPPEMVYVEQLDSAHYITEPAKLDQYRNILDNTLDAALSRRKSVAFLEKMISLVKQRL